jgi:hypothetical protein
MIKFPRTVVVGHGHSEMRLVGLFTNFDLLVKHLTTHMPSIHVRTGPVVSDPAASIASTVIYNTSAQELGHFRALFTLITTRAGTGGTCTVTVSWNNGSAAQSSTSGAIALNTLGSEVDFVVSFVSGTAQNISYNTTVAASAGNPAYSLQYKLEFLS